MYKLIAALFVLFLAVGPAYAHNGMEHVMGTVESVTATSITVKTKDGQSRTVSVNSETTYSRMDKPVTINNLAIGDHVVIHANEKNEQLIAIEVKVGARVKGKPAM
jgi:hypothetical protein